MTIAPAVLRCQACSFVSGAGVTAWRRRRRAESIQRASPEERMASAVTDLREARSLLMVAQALLNDAASRSKWDIAGLAMDRGKAKQSSFGSAVRHLRNAEDLANDAFALLKTGDPIEARDLDTSPLLFGMDTAWLTDGLIPNVAVHLRIGEARTRAARTLERVEASLASLESRVS